MLAISIILFLIFIINLSIYWLLFLRIKNKEIKVVRLFNKLFPIIWTLSIVPIPIINSSLLRFVFPNNYSYFKDYWIYFILLGILFILVGINFFKRARKIYSVKLLDTDNSKLITHGIFRLIRHPIYSAWGIIYLGAAIISDSLIALIFSPLIFIILEINALFKERFVLIPKYGKKYEDYKKKTPNRIIPTPLNFLLIIITIIILYVGFLNMN